MLIPFFTFVIFLILVVILGSSEATPEATKTYNERRSESILNKVRENNEKERQIIEDLKNTPTELRPVPVQKLDIEKSYFEKTNVFNKGGFYLE